MHQTKLKYKNKQRTITKKLSKQELRIIHIALPLDEIDPPTKFHNHSYCSFGDMLQTKFKYENIQKAITQTLSEQELRFMSIALPLDEIYAPTKFHNDSQFSFGDKLQTKTNCENKQRAITQKLRKQELRLMCTALPLDEIY